MLSRPFQRGFHLFQTSGFRKLNQRNICCTSDRTPVVNYFSSFNFSESIAPCGRRPGFCGESCSEGCGTCATETVTFNRLALTLLTLLSGASAPARAESLCLHSPPFPNSSPWGSFLLRQGRAFSPIRNLLVWFFTHSNSKVVILNLTGGIRRPTTWCYVGQDLQIPAS